jgi:hypothetical protein
MIDQERNLQTTYRIERHVLEGQDGVDVTAYPKTPTPTLEGWYRTDQLPQWLVEAMALLDAAYPGLVFNLGYRISDTTYWIEPVQPSTSGHQIAEMINRNHEKTPR